ncbi:hypothetical protein KY363_03970, partial [Candidatus Woesearchaeota archaeon]|nr:hypothetical protein [Candidatus Woesearchaeota archaeon]
TFEDASIKHRLFRDKIYHFMLYYFLPYHNMDFDNTLIYFVASRYEFQNKGIDIAIKALAKLDRTLRDERSKRRIAVFFWVPSGIRGIKTEIVENKMLFKDIEDTLKDNSEHILWHLLNTIVADRPITRDAIFDKEFLDEIRKKVLRFKRDTTSPPVCTHDLADPNDQILRAFRESGLSNSEDSRVKVIYYPIYLTGADNLLDLTYDESILGSHLGIFPSYYEPWGYTPLESGALGVASITSDLAGFGRYLKSQDIYKSEGIYILERMNGKHEDPVEALHKLLYYYTMLPKKKRIENKIEARALAKLADWTLLVRNYLDAQELAIKRVFGS